MSAAEHEVDAPRPDRDAKPDPREQTSERLLALLEEASEGSRELDDEIAFALSAAGERVPCGRTERAGKLVSSAAHHYTTSLDAALSLYESKPEYIPTDPLKACVEALRLRARQAKP